MDADIARLLYEAQSDAIHPQSPNNLKMELIIMNTHYLTL